MNSHNPFSFSHLQECCWSEGQVTSSLSVTETQEDGNVQTRKVFSGFFQYVVVDLLRCFKWLETYVRDRKMLLSRRINNNKRHDLIKFIFQEQFFRALPSFSEARSFDPENGISTPLWKHCHCLWVTSQLPPGVSNHVLWKAKSVLVSF